MLQANQRRVTEYESYRDGNCKQLINAAGYTWWSSGWSVGRDSRGRRRCRFNSSCMIITSYRHVLTVVTVVDAPSVVDAMTQISGTRARTVHVAQPDRSTPGHMYVAKYMSHVSVIYNDHTMQGRTSHSPTQQVGRL